MNYSLEKEKTRFICPLCHSGNTKYYTKDKLRSYLICNTCALVFVPENQHISDDQEKRRYDQHNNNPDDPGYRKFLSRLANPLCQRLPAGASGLDFGCGPGPALAAMFREKGFEIEVYDKFYAKDDRIWVKSYDFITATEVLEHLRQPGQELELLWRHLKTGGILGIMTKLVKNKAAFETWHYKRDPTHVCFFSTATFNWIANTWKASMELIGSDVILMCKKKTTAKNP
jgi:hypothetical protein